MQNLTEINEHQLIKDLIPQCPKNVDLTKPAHAELMIETANALSKEYDRLEKIDEIEQQLIDQYDKSLIFILLALKITRSKLIVNSLKEPLKVSVVFAVYKEHNRIKTSEEHPHGEDFLRKKVAQLEWLFGALPNCDWELIVVDDGCPENSGQMAQAIVDQDQLNDRVKVLFLKEAIEKGAPPVKSLSSTNESQKGGSITYGMWKAAQENTSENHIIVFTDADLSTHLGQVGLLIGPLVKQNKSAAIGSRREPNSVVIKKGKRNNRGKLFIYLWKRLIPNLGDIVDTQCGFKAFRREMVVQIIEDMIEKKFAFDIELLLKTALIKNDSITKVPIAWIDSEEASTTTDIQPYLPMLQSIAKMYQKYFPKNASADSFAEFILSLDKEAFNELLDHIPNGILEREPIEFTNFDGVRVEDLNLTG